MEPEVSFGAWLGRRRRALGLTQKELAHCVGCSVSAIRKIELDERRPSRQIAELLAGCLKIPANEREKFLKVARGEAQVDRLSSAPPSPLASRIPAPSTPLIGREHEVTRIAQLLRQPDCRLLTLIGPGGIGKTRVAIQAATDLREQFADGVYFVPLAPVASVDFIVPTMADAIGFTFYGTADPRTQLFTHLRDKDQLLVLDNMEHLLDGAAGFSELLEAAPKVKLLVTSHERLNLSGEWLFDIQALPFPEDGRDFDFEQYSALQLFVQRAQRALSTFTIRPADRSAVARICRLVEGLPLAIELAAAWVRVLTCPEIAQEIERDIGFLSSTARDVPARHRSIRAVLDQSWRLLAESERKGLASLSVFRGGFTREAAQAVAGASLAVLSALVSKSLLRYTGAERYDVHELVRQDALERLIESGQVDHVQRRHAQFYLALVDRAEPELKTADQAQWINRLVTEYENIRAVLAWSQQHDVELGLKLCGSIRRFWKMHSIIGEGRTWLKTFIAHSPSPTAARATALRAACELAILQGEYETARAHCEEALPIFQQLGDRRGIATSFNELGVIAQYQGEYAAARQLLEQSLAIKRELGDDWLIANSIVNLGLIADYQHDYGAAYALYQESLALYRTLNETSGVAIASSNLGHTALHLGRWDEARAWQAESLKLFNAVADKDGLTECLERFAMLANAHADFRRAARLFGAANVLRKEAGTTLPPAERAEYDRELNATRAQLDAATFDAEWRAGQALTLEQAMELALNEAAGPRGHRAEEEIA
jgi:predicted ATPase/DNA-binding XRE family transcriptional regulator